MTSRRALQEAYRILSPYADKQLWEFDNNLFHLDFISRRTPSNKRILDLGCGIGILSLALKIMGYKVTGIDKYIFEKSTSFSVNDIQGLRKIWQDNGLEIIPGDAHADGSRGTFDVVASIAVIEHQSDLKSYVNGLARYTHDGGMIYIATPNIANLLNRFRFLFGRAPLGNIREFYQNGGHFTGHWREYTVDELNTIAGLSKLEIVEDGNVQTLKPYVTRNWRKWHRLVARFLGGVIPGCGDTNFLWVRKS